MNGRDDDRNKSGYVQKLMDSLIERSNAEALQRFIQLERDRSFREALEVISPSKGSSYKKDESLGPTYGGGDLRSCPITRDIHPE